MGFGPETQAILRKFDELISAFKLLSQSSVGSGSARTNLPSVLATEGMRVTQDSISKGTAFSNIEFNTDGYNIVQISSGGVLNTVTYQVRRLDGTLSEAINAGLSPQVVGFHQAVVLSNSLIDAANTVYITKWLVPWSAIPGIWSTASGYLATAQQFTPILKGVLFNAAIANNATQFFVSNLVPSNPVSLFRFWVSLNTTAVLTLQEQEAAQIDTSLVNNGVALTGGNGYGPFDIMVESGTSFNFLQSIVGGNTIGYMVVEEIPAGTQ